MSESLYHFINKENDTEHDDTEREDAADALTWGPLFDVLGHLIDSLCRACCCPSKDLHVIKAHASQLSHDFSGLTHIPVRIHENASAVSRPFFVGAHS